MRGSTISNLAILATSLLAKDALAAPYDRRDVVVTQIATVTAGDGSFPTSAPIANKAAAPASPPASSPDSSPSSDSSNSPPPSSGSKNSNKRGLAYNDASLLKGFTGPGSKAGWCYNWDQKPGSIPSGLEYVPMLHDFRSDKVSSWVSNANAALSAGATHLQFINEPDMSSDPSVGGCDTSPQDAADGYVKHMMLFKDKAKLGSPAVSNGVKQPGTEKPAGIPYLNEFFKACSSCHFDFVPLHWYGTDPSDLKKHIQDVRDAVKDVKSVAKNSAGEPSLWITEFGLNGGNPESISGFLENVMPWLDGQDFVERYAYQFVADKFLVTGTTPNKAGKTFAGVS
jgi:hypothetical protein